MVHRSTLVSIGTYDGCNEQNSLQRLQPGKSYPQRDPRPGVMGQTFFLREILKFLVLKFFSLISILNTTNTACSSSFKLIHVCFSTKVKILPCHSSTFSKIVLQKLKKKIITSIHAHSTTVLFHFWKNFEFYMKFKVHVSIAAIRWQELTLKW